MLFIMSPLSCIQSPYKHILFCELSNLFYQLVCSNFFNFNFLIFIFRLTSIFCLSFLFENKLAIHRPLLFYINFRTNLPKNLVEIDFFLWEYRTYLSLLVTVIHLSYFIWNIMIKFSSLFITNFLGQFSRQQTVKWKNVLSHTPHCVMKKFKCVK